MQEQATVADVGKTVQSPASVVTRHASDLANTKSAGKALKGCFVAGTQVVVGENPDLDMDPLFVGLAPEGQTATREICDPQTASFSSVAFVAMGLFGIGVSLTTGKRRKEQGESATLDGQSEDTPESLSPKMPIRTNRQSNHVPLSPGGKHSSQKRRRQTGMKTVGILLASFLLLVFGLWGMIASNTTHMSPALPDSAAILTTASHLPDQPAASSSQQKYLTKNIEDIQVGDLVYAYDIVMGETTQRPVTEVFRHQSNHLRYLAVEDSGGKSQTFVTTDVHPYWVATASPDADRMAREMVMVENVGSSPLTVLHEKLGATEHGYYVEAGDLLPGDVFLGPNGELATLAQAWRVEYPEGTPVHNFHVANDHNYFVIANYTDYANGAQPVLVHNKAMFARPIDEPYQVVSVLVIDSKKYPEMAENISHAQKAGHPDILTLGPGKQAAIANRKAAVSEVPIRRDGTSRDEYPFASTVEGGEGAWVGHVAVGEQSAQGGLLSQFFKNNGINPGDKFRVVVE